MSWNPALEPQCPDAGSIDSIETLIVPRSRDIGEFSVRRALPAPRRQMVGPFIFFDHMGPVEFLSGHGIDVRPHPHIGLATVTYLYDGEFQHRDSLGTDQIIRPGAVNWMIAGHGVTHSERTSVETRAKPHSVSGIQTWVALPETHEDMEPAFEHHGKDALPMVEGKGKRVKLILGHAFGANAPAQTCSSLFYADAILEAGARIPLPDDHEDRGVYIVSGSVNVAGDEMTAGRMAIFRPGDRITLTAGAEGARMMLLGGETLGGPRFIWWNFVASSRDRIEEAKEDWASGRWDDGRFRLPLGDEDEYVPAPQR
jgi:redox-sensitive bicupin YhaK (pirin superfamily)